MTFSWIAFLMMFVFIVGLISTVALFMWLIDKLPDKWQLPAITLALALLLAIIVGLTVK